MTYCKVLKKRCEYISCEDCPDRIRVLKPKFLLVPLREIEGYEPTGVSRNQYGYQVHWKRKEG